MVVRTKGVDAPPAPPVPERDTPPRDGVFKEETYPKPGKMRK